jgi:SAM domain (Sterile alpha motif)
MQSFGGLGGFTAFSGLASTPEDHTRLSSLGQLNMGQLFNNSSMSSSQQQQQQLLSSSESVAAHSSGSSSSGAYAGAAVVGGERRWRSSDIDTLLSQLQLSHYSELLARRGVTSVADCQQLRESDYIDMGLPLGPRVKLVQALQQRSASTGNGALHMHHQHHQQQHHQQEHQQQHHQQQHQQQHYHHFGGASHDQHHDDDGIDDILQQHLAGSGGLW